MTVSNAKVYVLGLQIRVLQSYDEGSGPAAHKVLQLVKAGDLAPARCYSIVLYLRSTQYADS
jgi:hypothetical protein